MLLFICYRLTKNLTNKKTKNNQFILPIKTKCITNQEELYVYKELEGRVFGALRFMLISIYNGQIE